jgi:hypothetical protein
MIAARSCVAISRPLLPDSSLTPTGQLSGTNMMLIHLRARDEGVPGVISAHAQAWSAMQRGQVVLAGSRWAVVRAPKLGDEVWYIPVVRAVTWPRLASSGCGSLSCDLSKPYGR